MVPLWYNRNFLSHVHTLSSSLHHRSPLSITFRFPPIPFRLLLLLFLPLYLLPSLHSIVIFLSTPISFFLCFLHPFFSSFLPSFLLAFLPSCLPYFLLYFLASFLPSFFPSFLLSFLPSFFFSLSFFLLPFVNDIIYFRRRLFHAEQILLNVVPGGDRLKSPGRHVHPSRISFTQPLENFSVPSAVSLATFLRPNVRISGGNLRYRRLPLKRLKRSAQA